jgi:DNA replication initiation complex subunit (GINS family)
LSEINYNAIKTAWEDEISNEGLQDLADLRLSKMISYLSKVRLELASTNADNILQADLLTQEALNIEFMLKDLLEYRRNKILKAALSNRKPTGDMTLTEEGFYKATQRAFDSHTEFVKESLSGASPKPKSKPKEKKGKTAKKKQDDHILEEETDDIDYVVVRFLRPIEEQFMGLDEKTHGPFAKESVAKLPAANVRIWLRDGTASRIVPEDEVIIDE